MEVQRYDALLIPELGWLDKYKLDSLFCGIVQVMQDLAIQPHKPGT